MSGDNLRPPESQRRERRDRPRLVPLQRQPRLVLGFVEVNQERHRVLDGQVTRTLQRRGVERVDGVWRDGGNNQAVLLELLDELLGPREPVSRRLRVGNRKLDDALTEDAAETRRARRARNLLLEVIHVGVGRRPRTDHLEGGELGPDRARTPATPFLLRRERCTSAASPSAPGRRPARDRGPSARGCGC